MPSKSVQYKWTLVQRSKPHCYLWRGKKHEPPERFSFSAEERSHKRHVSWRWRGVLTLIRSIREEVKVILSEDFEFGKTSSDCVRRNKNNQFSLHTLAEACRRIHKWLFQPSSRRAHRISIGAFPYDLCSSRCDAYPSLLNFLKMVAFSGTKHFEITLLSGSHLEIWSNLPYFPASVQCMLNL